MIGAKIDKLALNDLDAGERQARRLVFRAGTVDKREDVVVIRHGYRIELGPVMDNQGCRTAAVQVVLPGGPQVYIGEYITVDDQQGGVGPKSAQVLDAAAGSQDLRFMEQGDPGLVILLVDIVFHLPGQVVQVDGDVLKTVVFQLVNEPVDERPSADWKERFGGVFGVRPEPGAQAGCKNKGFHIKMEGIWRTFAGLRRTPLSGPCRRPR